MAHKSISQFFSGGHAMWRAVHGCALPRASLIHFQTAQLVIAAHPKLRPYQEECIVASLAAYAQGVTRQAVSLPVGSGKTVIFSNLIARLPQPKPGANKVLVLAHREELIAQAARQISLYAPELRVAIEQGSQKCNVEDADVIVASVPTLGRTGSGSERLLRFDPHLFKAVIIDEAHHAAADTYRRVVSHFRPDMFLESGRDSGAASSDASLEALNCEIQSKESHIDAIKATAPPPLLWGCSATLMRCDERALGDLFERIVYHMDTAQAIRDGWLAPAQTRQISTDIDIGPVGDDASDFDPRALSLAIDTPVRNALVAATWHQVAWKEHRRQSTIVFGLNVQHVENLAAAFGQIKARLAHSIGSAEESQLPQNFRVEVVTGETHPIDRARILCDFAAGDVHVLLNCAVLTEGTDLPRTDCILMTRPTCSAGLYVQMVGRGLRRSESKDYCLVLDFVDRMRATPRSLVTFPSLLQARHAGRSKEDHDEELTVCEDGLTKETSADPVSDLDARFVRIHIEDPTADAPKSHAGFEDEALSTCSATAPPDTGLAWIQLSRRFFALCCQEQTLLLEIDRNNPAKGQLHIVVSADDQSRTRHRGVRHEKALLLLDSNGHPVPNVPDLAESPSLASGRQEDASMFVHELMPRLRYYLEREKLAFMLSASASWRRVRPPTSGQARTLFHIFSRIDSANGPGTHPASEKAMRARHGALIYGSSVGRASDIISKHTLLTRLRIAPMPTGVPELLRGVQRV